LDSSSLRAEDSPPAPRGKAFFRLFHPPERFLLLTQLPECRRKPSALHFKSVVEKLPPNGYSIPMTVIERQILDRLIELDEKVKALPTANPKPNLLPLFQQIEELADQLPRSSAPDLLHYMQKKSYEKARLWLEGSYAEIQKGGCRR